MTEMICRNCKLPYRAGRWAWALWQCKACTRKGVTPDNYRLESRLIPKKES